MRRINHAIAHLTAGVILVMMTSKPTQAQQVNSDSLFYQARQLAFVQKDLGEAIRLMHQVIALSPKDADYQIFLGRLYSWNHQPDSARFVLNHVVIDHPKYVDGYRALADLQFWNHQNAAALNTIQLGLGLSPQDEHLLLRKAEVLREMGQTQQANTLMDSLHHMYPDVPELTRTDSSARPSDGLNRVGVTYDWVHFNQQFRKDWNLVSVSYERDAKVGTLIGRLNYANRFSTSGFLPELDFYPHISPAFYGYLNIGFSDTLGVFPRTRAGASLYAKLPKGFEADAGFRYLKYDQSLWIYTASLGKYLHQFWVNFRTYLNPDKQHASATYIMTVRYYYGGKDDYAFLMASSGISPDDASTNALLKLNQKLKSRGIGAGCFKTLGKANVLTLSVNWAWQQYTPTTTGHQIDAGLGYFRNF